MTILFFDTESTGLPSFRLPTGHDDQPHCVQLAAILTADDGREISQVNVIIKPEGWSIPDGAANIHGITTDIAKAVGIREVVASGLLCDLAACADTVVAHNIKFDRQIAETMFQRAGRGWRLPDRQFCTAEASASIVNLPPTDRMIAAGIDRPKTPKLEECIQHFFGEELNGAHDALVDVRACMRVYFAIQKEQLANVNTPRVLRGAR